MHRKCPAERINQSLSTDWSLNAIEVEKRRIHYGNNDIVESSGNRWLSLAKDTLLDPMIWFLVGTSFLFGILGNFKQSIILLLATIPLIGIDGYLHWRTQVSTQSLSSRLATLALVIRNGIEFKIPAAEIVPGDLIVVNPGQYFPADGIIIAGEQLQAEESSLTGESVPVLKQCLNTLPEEIAEPVIDFEYWGFAGTRLLTGRALMRVVFTGKETLYGEIVTVALHTLHEKTPLQISIAKLVLNLIITATIICIILAIVRYSQGFGVIDAILSAATLAVAALPDEFPIVFTFFLGVGIYRLAQKNALVRRAVSVENIGRITCICSDKTGTITEGRFRFVQSVVDQKISEDDLIHCAFAASRTERGDPIDLAIQAEKIKRQLIKPEFIATFPFTEERKRETSLITENNQTMFATKGSPETIFALCDFTADEKIKWQESVSNLAKEGYKVIACARQVVEKYESPVEEPQSNYQFCGLLAFSDPPRKEVFSAIKQCIESQIHVLMVTGDHPETAKSIAKNIGLGKENPMVMLADEVIQKLETHSAAFLKSVHVIARAIPTQKLTFVQALQSLGEIVAVTGDGVNDVPALKAADVGIAMGERGTQSAREVSSIVLLDDNFGSIVNAISEGRQLFKNLKLSFKYLMMIHIPFILSAAIIPLFGFPLLYHPIHIVFVELIIHPTSLLVFQELPDHNRLKPRVASEKLHFFSNYDWLSIIVVGFYTTLLVLFGYILTLKLGASAEHARGMAITLLGFTSAAITASLSGLRSRVSQVITACVLFATIILVQTPLLKELLAVTALSTQDWLIVILTSIVTLFLVKI